MVSNTIYELFTVLSRIEKTIRGKWRKIVQKISISISNYPELGFFNPRSLYLG